MIDSIAIGTKVSQITETNDGVKTVTTINHKLMERRKNYYDNDDYTDNRLEERKAQTTLKKDPLTKYAPKL